MPTSCVPLAGASSSLKAALVMATNTFQNLGGEEGEGSFDLEENMLLSSVSRRFSQAVYGGKHNYFRRLAGAPRLHQAVRQIEGFHPHNVASW